MASLSPCVAQMSRLSIATGRQNIASMPARFLAPATQVHQFSSSSSRRAAPKKIGLARSSSNPQKNKQKGATEQKKKKVYTEFRQYDRKDALEFSLCEAIRYLRAVEVGKNPKSVKYELAVKLKTLKNGAVVRNRLRLPHPVKTDVRICVICPKDSTYAEEALKAGAVLVGEEEVFEAVKDGRIDFDRCICQTDSLAKMNKAQMGRFLGPKGLMPSAKMGTVVKDPSAVMKDMVGALEYRERMGVIRTAIGQLAFTPEQLSVNIKTFMDALKKDIAALSEKINKEVAEVVLSSTNGPGFPLNGTFLDKRSNLTTKDLST